MSIPALALALLASSPAFADPSFLPPRERAVPTIKEWKKARSSWLPSFLKEAESVPDLTPEQKKAYLERFTTNLKNQYAALAAVPKPAQCTGQAAADYVTALRATGAHSACVQFAQDCGASSDNPLVAMGGAACESDRQNISQAEAFFSMAAAQKLASSPAYDIALLSYAEFEAFGPHPELVDPILAREPAWDAGKRALWKAVILRSGRADTGSFSKEQIDKFLNDEIAQGKAELRPMLYGFRINFELDDGKLADALKDLFEQSAGFRTPMSWYLEAYEAVYEGFGDDFRMARDIYDVYDRYADQWVRFPTEENTYTYTELYGSACQPGLLSGGDLDAFKKLRAGLRDGSVTFDAALAQVTALAKKFPAKADVMTMYGGLLAQAGRHDEALKAYWQAHRACRYYDRANWGLVLEKRYRKYSSLPDYAANEEKAAEAVKGIQIPDVTPKYFVNWNSLTASLRERVLYGSRIWVPYYRLMFAANSRVFIKSPFDLLSDTPGMSDIADQRIEGDGHVTDHRLWDDVRGVGGEVVAADAEEVFQGVQGDYNLLGHEMTHQFHQMLSDQSSPLTACIDGQYAAALKAHNFPDDYSSVNSKEFFAQGVTYYLVPPDSPQRFGLNQSWLPSHDPAQFDFIRSIDTGGGDLSRIQCRVK